jgi:hypothetical protein
VAILAASTGSTRTSVCVIGSTSCALDASAATSSSLRAAAVDHEDALAHESDDRRVVCVNISVSPAETPSNMCVCSHRACLSESATLKVAHDGGRRHFERQ